MNKSREKTRLDKSREKNKNVCNEYVLLNLPIVLKEFGISLIKELGLCQFPIKQTKREMYVEST